MRSDGLRYRGKMVEGMERAELLDALYYLFHETERLAERLRERDEEALALISSPKR